MRNQNIILIHKKEDDNDFKNYKHISLLSVVSKLFTKVTVNRINESLYFQQSREQAGFKKGYSTIDRYHEPSNRKITRINLTPLHGIYRLRKAFDSVKTVACWKH